MFTWLARWLLGGAAGDSDFASDVLQPLLLPRTLVALLLRLALRRIFAVRCGEPPDSAAGDAVADAMVLWVFRKAAFIATLWVLLRSGSGWGEAAARCAGDADALTDHYHGFQPLSWILGWACRGGAGRLLTLLVPPPGSCARGAELARAAAGASVGATLSAVVQRHAVSAVSAAVAKWAVALWAQAPDQSLGVQLASAVGGLAARAVGSAVGHVLCRRGGWGAHVGGIAAHFIWRRTVPEPARVQLWTLRRRHLRLTARPTRTGSAPTAVQPPASDQFPRPPERSGAPRKSPGPGFGFTEQEVQDGVAAADTGVDYYAVLRVPHSASRGTVPPRGRSKRPTAG
eukprot:TRINITY_DN19773_c0_g1_i1.p1 TRINITY_DN19773_c0_g1~~TRINITY_DN19773_c0_g1_i1.p1  ORF type:complete len:383 (+),score=53.15 TRINITY_DN19773_c0_g1_i1:118-1149(+)